MLWLLLALIAAVPAGVALAILAGGRAHAAVFPYYATIACKVIGALGVLDRRLGLGWLPAASVTTYATLARHRVRNFRRIARAFRALDALPTVQQGLRTVGLRRTLDAQIRRDRLARCGVTPPLQRPYFFLPGVPAQMFYEAADFEWAAELERAFPIVRDELLAVLADDRSRAFRTYSGEFGHVTSGWKSLNFFLLGERVEENCARCPRTCALLESLPRFDRLHVMFSALSPGAHIGRHCGPMNGMLRAHLPLIVPEGCGLRVGDEVRAWEEGKVLVFDDSFEHEVWNHGDSVRVVLFMSFWHTCFAPEELPVLEELRHVLSSEILLHGEWKLRQQPPEAVEHQLTR